MGLRFGFGDRLAKLRADRGLRQADVGKGLGTNGIDVSKSVVYGWEKEQHYPRVDQLRAMCDQLRTTPDYLLYGVEADLPFSRELSMRLALMPRESLRELENYIRGYLRMPPVTDEQKVQEVDSSHARAMRSEADSATSSEPVQKQSAILDRLTRGEPNAGRQSGEIQKPRRRGNT